MSSPVVPCFLGGEAIHEEREIDLPALGANPPGVCLQGRQLILEDHLGIIEEAADQGGLAVIHRAACDEPQQGLGLMRRQIGVDVRRDEVRDVSHQK